MSAVDPNLSPVIVIPASGGATLPVTDPSELLDGASPDRFFTTADDGRGQLSTAAQVRSILGIATTPPLTSSAGWTLRAGAGGATITGGVARLTLGSGVVPGAWSAQPAAAYPHAITGRPPFFSVDAVARLATLTGGNSSDVYVSFGLRTGASGTASGFLVNFRGDGNSTFGYADTIGANASFGAGAPGRSNLAGGQFWARLVIFGGTVYAYYGVGSAGAEPTSWTLIGSSANVSNVTPASIGALTFAVDAGGGGSPTAITVEWDSISARLVGIGAL